VGRSAHAGIARFIDVADVHLNGYPKKNGWEPGLIRTSNGQKDRSPNRMTESYPVAPARVKFALLESNKSVSPNAVKRLKAIEEFTMLGAG
jgi:hypothetical protein